jgi:hypothetical protein
MGLVYNPRELQGVMTAGSGVAGVLQAACKFHPLFSPFETWSFFI